MNFQENNSILLNHHAATGWTIECLSPLGNFETLSFKITCLHYNKILNTTCPTGNIWFWFPSLKPQCSLMALSWGKALSLMASKCIRYLLPFNHFVRATLTLHGWSWLSITLMYRLFYQDLWSQKLIFILSLKRSMMSMM